MPRPPQSQIIDFPMPLARDVEAAFRQDQRRAMIRDVARILETYSTEYRADASIPPNIRQLLDELERAQVADERLRQIRALVEGSGQAFAADNFAQVNRQIVAILGVNLSGLGTRGERELRRYIRDNVGLIKRLGETSKTKVRAVVEEAFIKRQGPETLQERLTRRIRVAESHAALIARDQGNKFFGSLTEARHRDAGARRYIWVTSRDEAVRPEHAAREGQVFDYDDPPDDGHPGQPIQCRCTATPIFED